MVMPERVVHKLKTVPPFFEDVLDGSKDFEVRFNDREFVEGDWLLLEEWSSAGGYTGRNVLRQIVYILHGEYGLAPGYVVLGLA